MVTAEQTSRAWQMPKSGVLAWRIHRLSDNKIVSRYEILVCGTCLDYYKVKKSGSGCGFKYHEINSVYRINKVSW